PRIRPAPPPRTPPIPPTSPPFPYTPLFRSVLQLVRPATLVVAEDAHAPLGRERLEARLDHREARPALDRLEEELHERRGPLRRIDRKSTRLNSSHVKNSYAVFCWQKKKRTC